ncbi:M23 family metallopeptidase [Clostridium sp. 19966]|uniref:M23 family metallopeptidase n=1 Tax=Clostridium sp. 19966 TaxID=2768166 RepID=UPI0028E994D0|nr:M23 family metallopeptidase [Clostridium sp. 19966]
MHYIKFSKVSCIIMLCTLFLCVAVYFSYTPKAGEIKNKVSNQNVNKAKDKEINQNTNKVIQTSSQNSSSANTTSMLPPSRGVISSKFGTRWGKMHQGVDIAADLGTPIKAALDGKVIYSSWMEGYGNTIELQHQGEVVTLYGHCSKRIADLGQYVKKGDVIGLVGSTGRSTGPHLHFEVRINGTPVDPQGYVALGS